MIAVVEDILLHLDFASDSPPGAYFSITQPGEDEKYSYTAVVRMHGPAGALADAVRKAWQCAWLPIYRRR